MQTLYRNSARYANANPALRGSMPFNRFLKAGFEAESMCQWQQDQLLIQTVIMSK
jgi:hypothetical protein